MTKAMWPALALVLVVAGCQDRAPTPLIGTWELTGAARERLRGTSRIEFFNDGTALQVTQLFDRDGRTPISAPARDSYTWQEVGDGRLKLQHFRGGVYVLTIRELTAERLVLEGEAGPRGEYQRKK